MLPAMNDETIIREPHIDDRYLREWFEFGLREGNADFAVVADFDDEDGWRLYTEDPEHRRVIEELIAPVTEVRSAIQLRHP